MCKDSRESFYWAAGQHEISGSYKDHGGGNSTLEAVLHAREMWADGEAEQQVGGSASRGCQGDTHMLVMWGAMCQQAQMQHRPRSGQHGWA